MSLFTVCAFAVTASVLAVYFKQVRSEFAVPLVLVCSLVLLKTTLSMIFVNFEFIKTVFEMSSMNEYTSVLLKTIGVSLTVQTASDICKDAGENAIASKVELFGKAEVLIISIPLIKKIFEVSQEIMS